MATLTRFGVPVAKASPNTARFQLMEVSCLLLADLFFVAEEMFNLARVAAQSLPPFTLLPEDVPTEFGLAYLAPGTYMPPGELNSVAAVEWRVVPGCGVTFAFFCDTELMLNHMADSGKCTAEQAAHHRSLFGPLSPMHAEAMVHFGRDPLPGDRASSEDEEFMRVIRSMWLLMQQPLADVAEVELDRAAKRRLQRAGREPSLVRVISLRRPQSDEGAAGTGRDYAHQWVVRGHWRNHWHPKRQVHRPVWIAPHIKGPDGAPLIGGEKVYAWKR
ncbi:hypothetical protein ACFZCU_46110 [Streptomyces canus]|uniref:hypothetical protein n=1 Tax=Streptomyces canus TaxID=58343 RepID=UPI0036E178F9